MSAQRKVDFNLWIEVVRVSLGVAVAIYTKTYCHLSVASFRSSSSCVQHRTKLK